MRELYPPIEPYRSGMLDVGDGHQLYFEECGNPKGKPIVFLHGGPGGGCSPEHRRFFDPKKWRIVLFDQRGCGQSLPFASLENNTTWHLVADIEKLRGHLEIEKWAVFGGSWGSTLALAYAISHPTIPTALFLRGIFLCRRKEIEWFYQEGASKIFPDAWEAYLAPIPEAERGDLVRAYHKRLTGADPKVRAEAASAWSVWEGSTSKLVVDPRSLAHFAEDQFADAFARIECHYFMNDAFFASGNWLLENVNKIVHIPSIIVQGRYDVVCPMESAWELHRAWPAAEFKVIADAGHSVSEKGIASALIEATDRF
jgi:proline iminopeptidase